MKAILYILGLLAVVIGGVLVVGMSIPLSHTATLSRTVMGTPDEVWTLITDTEGFTSWRPGMRSVERLEDRDGMPVWREATSTGTMTLEVTEWSPPQRLVTRIADEDLPFGGTWTYELERSGPEQTFVTITEDGEIYNPFFRVIARYMTGYERTVSEYLEALSARGASGA